MQRPLVHARCLALVALLLPLLASPGPRPLAADPEPAAAGPVYKNAELGLTLTGPKGWALATSGALLPTWTELATFTQPGTQVDVLVSRRARRSASLAALEAEVRKEWEAQRDVNVTSLTSVEPTTLKPVGMVLLEANRTRKAAARPGAAPAPGTPPGAIVVWQLQVAYVLAPGHEVQVSAQGPLAAWNSARASVRALIDSLTLSAPPRGAEGEGVYRDDLRRFSLRYPKGYTVVIPQRERHLVELAPVSADEPVLGVYLLAWEGDVDRDGERLVKHFTEERGGEASVQPREVAGQPGLLVTGHVMESGRDTTILIALIKRGSELFRLRGSMPRTAEEAGKAAFDTFVKSFVFTTPTPPSGG